MRRWARVVVAVLSLTLIWVLLWGSLSAANVLSGLLVAAVLVTVLPALRQPVHPGRIRVGALLRLVGYMLVNVAKSNVLIIRDILSRRRRLHTGITGVPLPECSPEVVTLITSLLALTPGTIPLEVSEKPRAIYVHLLQVESVEGARRAVLHLVELCVRSFGSDDDVRSLERILARAA